MPTRLVCLMREVYALPANERRDRARRGRDLLLQRFTWTYAAERLVAAARSVGAKPPDAPAPRIGWVTSWNIPLRRHFLFSAPYQQHAGRTSLFCPPCRFSDRQ